MTEIIMKIIENPRASLLIFLFLLAQYIVPSYWFYRLEQRFDRCRIECGQPLVSTKRGGNYASSAN